MQITVLRNNHTTSNAQTLMQLCQNSKKQTLKRLKNKLIPKQKKCFQRFTKLENWWEHKNMKMKNEQNKRQKS